VLKAKVLKVCTWPHVTACARVTENAQYEANVMSLQASLQQKDVENHKISHICDELIGKLELPAAVQGFVNVCARARAHLSTCVRR
jgi:hypothetical protein